MTRDSAKKIALPVVLAWKEKNSYELDEELQAQVEHILGRLQVLNAHVESMRAKAKRWDDRAWFGMFATGIGAFVYFYVRWLFR